MGAISQLPTIAEMDAELEPHAAGLESRGVRPLAFVKQIATLLLVVNAVEFAERNLELRTFVLDRDRTGVPEGIRLYLALLLGPKSRLAGVQTRANIATGEVRHMSEIAHPPFAFVASFNEPSPKSAT